MRLSLVELNVYIVLFVSKEYSRLRFGLVWFVNIGIGYEFSTPEIYF
jgi:hypothetical protein